MYDGFVTAVLDERATLTAMDDATKQELAALGAVYRETPAKLREAVIAAGRRGDKPAEIHRAIGYVWTYDYVAKLVRDDRKRRKAV